LHRRQAYFLEMKKPRPVKTTKKSWAGRLSREQVDMLTRLDAAGALTGGRARARGSGGADGDLGPAGAPRSGFDGNRENGGMSGWTVAPMITSLRSLLGFRPPPPDDKVVIDQSFYYDSLERSQERQRLLEKDRERVACIVLTWATHTVVDRIKKPMPSKLPRAGVVRQWLDGLNVQEIFVLSNVGHYEIWQHIYGADRIPGVRKVQPLPPAVLNFPPPKKVDDQGRPGAGGGPRKPR
jgi:hypothetical protein